MYIRFFKRIIDIVAALTGLVILAPAFLFIACVIKTTSAGPVLFKQERVGKGFQPFFLYKFRSMRVDAPSKGPSVTRGGDPRITTIGRFLRRTKLDELPQLINVLKGDMSLVGPRPEVSRYIQHYLDDYAKVLSVRPGITDHAAIAFRDEEDILKEYDDVEKAYIEKVLPEKIKLYNTYIDTISFATDLRLIFSTLARIVR